MCDEARTIINQYGSQAYDATYPRTMIRWISIMHMHIPTFSTGNYHPTNGLGLDNKTGLPSTSHGTPCRSPDYLH